MAEADFPHSRVISSPSFLLEFVGGKQVKCFCNHIHMEELTAILKNHKKPKDDVFLNPKVSDCGHKENLKYSAFNLLYCLYMVKIMCSSIL